MTAGEKVRLAREKKGMTQEQLAHKLGYKSHSSIKTIECYDREIPETMLIPLAEALDVSPNYFRDDNDVELETKDILKRLRKSAGHSNTFELCKALGISQTAYSSYESGKRKPSTSQLIMIADYYNVSVDYILGRQSGNPVELIAKQYGMDDDEKEMLYNYLDLSINERKNIVSAMKLLMSTMKK